MRLIVIFFITLSWNAFAQPPIQSFSLLNVADDKMINFQDYTTSQGIAVIFTGNECVYDNFYRDRIKSLINTYSGRIQFLLVNSYPEPEESIEKMKVRYHSWSLSIPYLADKDQDAMTKLGARKSPEVFLLKLSNGKFTIVYSGAIDDNPQVSHDAKQHHFRDAMEKLLSNEGGPVSNVRAVGCPIRKKSP